MPYPAHIIKLADKVVCPISSELMDDPVRIAGTQHVLNRDQIEGHWATQRQNHLACTDPLNNEVLTAAQCVVEPVEALRQAIERNRAALEQYIDTDDYEYHHHQFLALARAADDDEALIAFASAQIIDELSSSDSDSDEVYASPPTFAAAAESADVSASSAVHRRMSWMLNPANPVYRTGLFGAAARSSSSSSSAAQSRAFTLLVLNHGAAVQFRPAPVDVGPSYRPPSASALAAALGKQYSLSVEESSSALPLVTVSLANGETLSNHDIYRLANCFKHNGMLTNPQPLIEDFCQQTGLLDLPADQIDCRRYHSRGIRVSLGKSIANMFPAIKQASGMSDKQWLDNTMPFIDYHPQRGMTILFRDKAFAESVTTACLQRGVNGRLMDGHIANRYGEFHAALHIPHQQDVQSLFSLFGYKASTMVKKLGKAVERTQARQAVAQRRQVLARPGI